MSLVAVLAVACATEYDDTELWGAVNSQGDRIKAIEDWQKQVNSDISALKALVTALESRDHITSVEPHTNGNGGYTVTLASGNTITINHGSDGDTGATGADGSTPVIGVKQDTDGVYYWTLNGEFIIVDGEKMPVTGPQGPEGPGGNDGNHGNDGDKGADGVTPQLKIENDYWYVSYDNGTTWTQLGKATGEDGANGNHGTNGDSFFQSVTQDDSNVYFTLADGTVITVPKAVTLSIVFDIDDSAAIPNWYIDVSIPYTVTSSGNVTLEAIASTDLSATIVPDDATGKTGVLKVTSTNLHADSKVVVFVTDGRNMIMRSVNFSQTTISVTDNYTKNVSGDGGEVTLEFLSNAGYQVLIPASAESWISVVPETRATMESYTVRLKIEPNTTGVPRTGYINLISADYYTGISYEISQGIPGEIPVWSGPMSGSMNPFIDGSLFRELEVGDKIRIEFINYGFTSGYIYSGDFSYYIDMSTLMSDPSDWFVELEVTAGNINVIKEQGIVVGGSEFDLTRIVIIEYQDSGESNIIKEGTYTIFFHSEIDDGDWEFDVDLTRFSSTDYKLSPNLQSYGWFGYGLAYPMFVGTADLTAKTISFDGSEVRSDGSEVPGVAGNFVSFWYWANTEHTEYFSVMGGGDSRAEPIVVSFDDEGYMTSISQMSLERFSATDYSWVGTTDLMLGRVMTYKEVSSATAPKAAVSSKRSSDITFIGKNAGIGVLAR
jgi:hypothetical protein